MCVCVFQSEVITHKKISCCCHSFVVIVLVCLFSFLAIYLLLLLLFCFDACTYRPSIFVDAQQKLKRYALCFVVVVIYYVNLMRTS